MGNLCADLCLARQNNNMSLYELKGNFRCKIVDVYDGDTVTIILINKLGFEKHKLRMYGYDSPEMKPKLNHPNRDEEKRKAAEAKKYLSDLVLNKILEFESMGYDKYGRLLGKLHKSNKCSRKININELMIKQGHGYPYYGGTKNTPSINKESIL
jgi:endonuclease YncB( thermonuclease family)